MAAEWCDVSHLADAFWGRFPGATDDACWLWPGGRTPGGYGTFSWRENGSVRGTPAHRMAYTLAKGPIPDGLTIDHLCRVRHCVNPAHLEAVTMQENVLRGVRWQDSQHAVGVDCGYKVCIHCRSLREQAA